MSDQLDLLNWRPNWRRGDPQTSRDAGLSMKKAAAEHCQRIYTVLREAREPLAAQQIADRLGWQSHVPVNRRLPELVDAGLIRETERRYKNRSGRFARCFEPTETTQEAP